VHLVGFYYKKNKFRYLEKTITNHNSIPKEIKSRVKSGNACYHSLQNLLFCVGMMNGFSH